MKIRSFDNTDNNRDGDETNLKTYQSLVKN